jgi:hypothetical protein
MITLARTTIAIALLLALMLIGTIVGARSAYAPALSRGAGPVLELSPAWRHSACHTRAMGERARAVDYKSMRLQCSTKEPRSVLVALRRRN